MTTIIGMTESPTRMTMIGIVHICIKTMVSGMTQLVTGCIKDMFVRLREVSSDKYEMIFKILVANFKMQLCVEKR